MTVVLIILGVLLWILPSPLYWYTATGPETVQTTKVEQKGELSGVFTAAPPEAPPPVRLDKGPSNNITLIVPVAAMHFGNGCIERMLECTARGTFCCTFPISLIDPIELHPPPPPPSSGTVVPRQIIVVISSNNPAYPIPHQNELNGRVDRWKARMPSADIRLLTNEARPNAGHNRNMGMKVASSEIVSFFDADDVPAHDRIATLIALFEMHPELDYVIHHFQRFSDMAIPASSWRAADSTVPPLFFEKGETMRKRPPNPKTPWLYNWDGQEDGHRLFFANGWPTVRRNVIDAGVQFGGGTVAEDCEFGNGVRDEARVISVCAAVCTSTALVLCVHQTRGNLRVTPFHSSPRTRHTGDAKRFRGQCDHQEARVLQ